MQCQRLELMVRHRGRRYEGRVTRAVPSDSHTRRNAKPPPSRWRGGGKKSRGAIPLSHWNQIDAHRASLVHIADLGNLPRLSFLVRAGPIRWVRTNSKQVRRSRYTRRTERFITIFSRQRHIDAASPELGSTSIRRSMPISTDPPLHRRHVLL